MKEIQSESFEIIKGREAGQYAIIINVADDRFVLLERRRET